MDCSQSICDQVDAEAQGGGAAHERLELAVQQGFAARKAQNLVPLGAQRAQRVQDLRSRERIADSGS